MSRPRFSVLFLLLFTICGLSRQMEVVVSGASSPGKLIETTSDNASNGVPKSATVAAAAESLQNQRTAFLSAILLYLNKPEESPTEQTITESLVLGKSSREEPGILGRVFGAWTARNQSSINQITARSRSSNLDHLTTNFQSLNQVTHHRGYFKHEDRDLNIRVLRSLRSEHEPRQASWPPSWVTKDQASADWGPFPEIVLKDTLGSETMMVEEVSERTPFNRSDSGELIMRDLPMVERRSIPQFGGMVTLYTRTSPLRLLYYGNWCGSGGMGPALDAIDHCCMDHDHCYGYVSRQSCIAFQKPYTVHYSWRWDDKRQQAYCLRTGDRCADLTCDCDRVAAACFSRHMINSRLEGNRLRKHRPSRPFRF